MTDPCPKSFFPAFKRGAWRLVRLAGYGYAGFLLMIYLLQSRLIFPGQYTQGKAFAQVKPPAGTELARLPASEGNTVAALYGPALSPEGHPLHNPTDRLTMLFFYGNGECLNYDLDRFDQLRRLGVNVMIPEYVGYGLSTGKAGEAGCTATADAAYLFLTTQKGVQPKRLMVVGWSLGGAVAIDLASRKPVGGLAAFSTFTSMVEMGHRQLPWLPVSVLLRHRFENERKLRQVACPVLLGHGDQDRRVPYEMCARLASAVKGPVRQFSVKGAGHNNFFGGEKGQVFNELRRFIRELDRQEPALKHLSPARG